MKLFKILQSISLQEILMKGYYLFKKKIGFYKHVKKPLYKEKLINLGLLNKEYLKSLDLDIFNYHYNILGNIIDISKLQFQKATKVWINEDLKTYGDIKNEWEINRLQFLFPLSIINLKTKDNLSLIIDIINNWQDANPYNYGVNWYSNLEVAIRAITLYFVYELTNLDLSQTLYEHGAHLYQEINYSKYCIPNNHVFGEATVLLLLGHAFNNHKWINKARKMIDKFSYLINEEGISIEGSFSYHFFTTQMLIILSFFYPKLTVKTNKALEFINAIIKPNGSLVNFGDNDEGFFYNPFWKKDILLILNHLKIFNIDLYYQKENKRFYNYQDYKIIKDEKRGFYLLFNGQKEKYHSHSDNLSVELVINNINILEDSGTYVYNGSPLLRHYFRSSLAHNTISFQNHDHSIQIGTFRWVKSVKTILSNNSLEGYLKTKDGTFKRRIEINDQEIKIFDEVNSKGKSIINFHFGKDVKLEQINNDTYKINDELYITFIGTCNITLTSSLISKSYNELSKRLNIRIETFGNNKLETKIYVKNG